jgi:hypothetical protein
MLDAARESGWAERLRAAVQGGATSGEILGRVGLELQALQQARPTLDEDLMADVGRAERFVAEALRPWRSG